MVESFYSEDVTDETRLGILNQFDVNYVFWGPAERSLGSYNLDEASFLSPVYSNDEVKLFRVQP